jgi:hypothetical protein
MTTILPRLLASGLMLLPNAAALAQEKAPTAAERAALLAPVTALAAAINQATPDTPSGVFTPDALVIDDFPPYRWNGQGPTGADAWYHGLVGTDAASHAAFVASKAVVTPGKPRFGRITGDAAYVVLPTRFDYLEDGKQIHQTGEWLFTEQRAGGSWLISGSSFAITSEKR